MFKEIISKYHKISLFIAAVAVNNIIEITPGLALSYYFVMLLALIYCIRQDNMLTYSSAAIWLILACIASILFNDIPSFFSPWLRLVTFVILLLLIGPVVQSEYLNKIRVEVFFVIQYLLQPIVIISFIMYLLGIITYSSHWVGYSGLTTHSMVLAPVCANVLAFSQYKLLYTDLSTKFRYYYIGLSVISILCMLLAASRTVIIGSVIILIIFGYYRLRENVSMFLKIVFVLGLACYFTESYWSPYLDALEEKNEGSIRAGGITSSREVHWLQRINEFESSPLFGVGFGCVSTDADSGATYDESSGKIETGSSWLSILSMIGLFGVIPVVVIFIKAIKRAVNIISAHSETGILFLSLIIFWCVHMCAEGYIFSAGGFMFFNVWLVIGTINGFYSLSNE